MNIYKIKRVQLWGRYMRRLSVILLMSLCIFLCSCTKDTTGYSNELVSSSWEKTLNGGAEVKLDFTEDTANLSIANGDLKTNIKGKYIADEKQFVIFVPKISQNYGFEYTPKGDTLELKYGDCTITLDRSK